MSTPAHSSQLNPYASSTNPGSPPSKADANGTSKFVSAAYLLAAPPMTLKFTVSGLMPVGLVSLVGRPKVGKSHFTFDLACSIGLGEDFLDQAVEEGSVLYYGFEDGQTRTQMRLNARTGASTASPKITFRNTDGSPPSIDQVVTEVDAWCKTTPDARLVVIDVIGLVPIPKVRGVSEYERMSAALSKLHAMAHEHEVSIVIVHHMNKRFRDELDIFDAALGTTAFTSVPDTLMAIVGTGPHDLVLHAKGRDVADQAIGISIDHEACRISCTEVAPGRHLSPEQNTILSLVRDGACTPRQLTLNSGLTRTSIQNILKKLVDAGHLERTRPGVYNLPGTSAPSDLSTCALGSAAAIDDLEELQPSHTSRLNSDESDDTADTSTPEPWEDYEDEHTPDSIASEQGDYRDFIEW